MSARTIAHHMNRPWQWQSTSQFYFFCANPACEIVYFGDDGSRLLAAQLRTRVGNKQATGDALLCYCYGVTLDDVRNDPAIRDFVIAETRLGHCACETRNPSGRCCLKDFPPVSSESE